MTDRTLTPDLPDDPEEVHEQTANEHASWDAFWAEVQREEAAERGEQPATEVIRGVTITVPHDLPLKFDRLLEQVKDSSSDEDTKRALAVLFGADVLDAWVEADMGSREFQVVLLWGIANGKGQKTSFREAYDLVRRQSEGKAPNSTRRSGVSGGSGGRSKRTSTRGTASANGTSRT